MSYSDYKKEVSEIKERNIDVSPSTFNLLKKTATATPKKSRFSKLFTFAFGLMALKSAFSQFLVAKNLIYDLPSLSLILIFKEIFGFVFIIKGFMKMLFKRPDKYLVVRINNPFDRDYGILSFMSDLQETKDLSLFKGLIFSVSSLSNLRSFLCFTLMSLYDVSAPFSNQESQLLKLGNIIPIALDLVIVTKNENKLVNIWLFKDLMIQIITLMINHVQLASKFFVYADIYADVDNGKLSQNDVKLYKEDLHQFVTGEVATDSFNENSNGTTNANKQKAD